MKYRHFKITNGPWLERTLELREEHERSRLKLVEIGDEMGCNIFHYQSSFSGFKSLAGFSLREGSDYQFQPDIWKFDKKAQIWSPRKRARTKDWAGEHAHLLEKLEPIMRVPQPWAVLDELGKEYGISNGPLVVVGNRAHSAGFTLVPDLIVDGRLTPVIFVTVPWPDTSGDDCNERFKQQLTLPPCWVEVKEWEKLRDIDLAETARKAREQS